MSQQSEDKFELLVTEYILRFGDGDGVIGPGESQFAGRCREELQDSQGYQKVYSAVLFRSGYFGGGYKR